MASPETSQKPVGRQTFSLFWATAAEHPRRLWAALLSPLFITLIANLGGPFVISVLLRELQSGASSGDAWHLLGWYAASQIIGEVVGWRLAMYAAWSFEVRGMRALYQRVFSHLSEQSIDFHANRFSGALVSQTNKLTGAFEHFWDTIVWQTIPMVTTVVAAVAILAVVVPWYSVFLAVMASAFCAFVILTSRSMEELNILEAQSSSRMTGLLSDVMTNIAAVKAHGAESAEMTRATAAADDWSGRSIVVLRKFMGISTGFASITAVTNIGAVAAAILVIDGDVGLDVSAVYLCITYTLTVTSQLWEMPRILRSMNKVLGDAHDMVTILEVSPDVPDRTDRPFVPGKGRIEFAHVGFAHSGSGEDALFEDFSLDVAAGEKIGLVGHSGSGKTTLTRLLLRFSDVDSGAIRVDGQDVRDVSQASLRTSIAYVAQEPLLFHRTIRENIAYGRPGATDAEIAEAARKAYAMDFIDNLSQGLDTLVGERGVKLSGGQRQRIAIARAILKDAPLLVLDEATSALDSESESHIQAALAQAMEGRTTIVIAHRLSTVQAMDRIIVLADGAIVEEGTHAQLRGAGGAYQNLWAHQSGGFIG